LPGLDPVGVRFAVLVRTVSVFFVAFTWFAKSAAFFLAVVWLQSSQRLKLDIKLVSFGCIVELLLLARCAATCLVVDDCTCVLVSQGRVIAHRALHTARVRRRTLVALTSASVRARAIRDATEFACAHERALCCAHNTRRNQHARARRATHLSAVCDVARTVPAIQRLHECSLLARRTARTTLRAAGSETF
jgi:hypothetical protein